MRWIGIDDPDIDDEIVWDAVGSLAMVTIPCPPDRTYLYVDVDFRAWLDKVETAIEQRKPNLISKDALSVEKRYDSELSDEEKEDFRGE